MTETAERRRTVADALESTKTWRENVEHAKEMGESWADGAMEQVEERERTLAEFPSDMPLLSFGEAMRSELLSDEEKYVLRWQRPQDWMPSSFEEHLMKAVEEADESNLDRLALGYPLAVRAIRQWRGTNPTPHGGSMGRRLRSLPLDFSI